MDNTSDSQQLSDIMCGNGTHYNFNEERPQSYDALRSLNTDVNSKIRKIKQTSTTGSNTHSVTLPKVVNHLRGITQRNDINYSATMSSKNSTQSRILKMKKEKNLAWSEYEQQPSKSNYMRINDINSKHIIEEKNSMIKAEKTFNPIDFGTIQQSLSKQKSIYSHNENQDRLKIMKNANNMIHSLPLIYLYSKQELKHYAIELIYSRLQLFADLRVRNELIKYFRRWKYPAVIKLQDKQIGFMVISKALQMMLDRMIGRAFKHWSIFYSTVRV